MKQFVVLIFISWQHKAIALRSPWPASQMCIPMAWPSWRWTRTWVLDSLVDANLLVPFVLDGQVVWATYSQWLMALDLWTLLLQYRRFRLWCLFRYEFTCWSHCCLRWLRLYWIALASILMLPTAHLRSVKMCDATGNRDVDSLLDYEERIAKWTCSRNVLLAFWILLRLSTPSISRCRLARCWGTLSSGGDCSNIDFSGEVLRLLGSTCG